MLGTSLGYSVGTVLCDDLGGVLVARLGIVLCVILGRELGAALGRDDTINGRELAVPHATFVTGQRHVKREIGRFPQLHGTVL